MNITCEVFAYPSATISWFRDGQLLPSSNYSNIKIYNTPSASYLEVSQGGGRKGWRRHSLTLGRLPYAAKSFSLACLTSPDQGNHWQKKKLNLCPAPPPPPWAWVMAREVGRALPLAP